jgi:hypothetical protein
MGYFHTTAILPRYRRNTDMAFLEEQGGTWQKNRKV